MCCHCRSFNLQKVAEKENVPPGQGTKLKEPAEKITGNISKGKAFSQNLYQNSKENADIVSNRTY